MNSKISLKLDLRVISILLLAVIIGMLALWRPWEVRDDRKITTTGQAEIEAVPDYYVFSPRFERHGTDIAAMKNELTTFGAELQKKLKELGVKEEDITLDSSSYEYGVVRPEGDDSVVTLGVTIQTQNKELAQKVQDYLATTNATGQLTATAQFSDTKRRDLENQVRDKAVDDARTKAERTAKNLHANLGKVLEVKDNAGFSVSPAARDGGVSKSESNTSLPVTPGKDTVTFSVEVTFELL